MTGDFDTILYERVDVVCGADGLLSSTGNPSATVNFVRKRPGNKLAAKAGLIFGRWGNERLDLDVTIPLSDNWAARTAVERLRNQRKTIYCVWSGQRLKDDYDIDHYLPFVA